MELRFCYSHNSINCVDNSWLAFHTKFLVFFFPTAIELERQGGRERREGGTEEHREGGPVKERGRERRSEGERKGGREREREGEKKGRREGEGGGKERGRCLIKITLTP